ncbi:MAG: hypothetical protein ACOCRV_00340 [bacterium]
MAEDKTLNLILSKIEDLDSKVEKLDSKVDSFRDKTAETLTRIEKRLNATFEQVGGLSEYRTKTEAQLDNIESDMSYYARKQIENEKEIYKLDRKLAK